jgi:tocopherol O-methyltransferase
VSSVRDYYDAIDPLYRSCWGTHLHHGWFETGFETAAWALGSFREQVCTRLNVQPGQRVCDVGCGYGEFARYVADSYRAEVTGLTLSPSQVGFASQFSNPSVLIVHRDWLGNRLPSNSFDQVVAVESLYHMADKATALSEIGRVLRVGGVAVITLWVGEPGSWIDRGMLAWGRSFGGLQTAQTYENWLEAASLDVSETIDCTSKVRPTIPALAKRVASTLWMEPIALSGVFREPAAAGRLAAAFASTAAGYACGALRYFIVTATKTRESNPIS